MLLLTATKHSSCTPPPATWCRWATSTPVQGLEAKTRSWEAETGEAPGILQIGVSFNKRPSILVLIQDWHIADLKIYHIWFPLRLSYTAQNVYTQYKYIGSGRGLSPSLGCSSAMALRKELDSE